MGKGENAHYEEFLLSPQCFQKACFPGKSKSVIVSGNGLILFVDRLSFAPPPPPAPVFHSRFQKDLLLTYFHDILYLQLHWNNPEKTAGYTDSSGINLYLTKKLRPYDAGVLMIGEQRMFIPPGKVGYNVHGRCDAECTEQKMKGDITVFSVFNHMHNLGGSISYHQSEDRYLTVVMLY